MDAEGDAGPARLAELAIVLRGGFTESRHLGIAVGLDATGDVAVALGDIDAPVLLRSAAKPLQAAACVAAGAPLTGRALALACGSHTGEATHVALVRHMLHAAGLDETALQCPPHLPEDSTTRNRLISHGDGPSPIQMNCSGKHTAMLAACAVRGWPTSTYLQPRHPLQQHIRSEIERLAGATVSHVTVDGCGAPVFALPLAALATALRACVLGSLSSAERRAVDAMRAHPWFVGGTGHANTRLMELLPGTVCKGGAEGVIAAASPDGTAIAVKIADGSPRPTNLVLLHLLARLGHDITPAASLARTPVLGGARQVGTVEPGLDLKSACSRPRA